MEAITAHLGQRGTLVIPAQLRRSLGLEEGTLVLMERREHGLFIRPAVAMAVEEYDARRKAMFMLNDSIDEPSYQAAREQVRKMGLDPDRIPHDRPRDADPRVP